MGNSTRPPQNPPIQVQKGFGLISLQDSPGHFNKRIGVIMLHAPNRKSKIGTGILISPNIVLSSAQGAFIKEYGKRNRHLTFSLMESSSPKIPCYNVEQIKYLSQSRYARRNDYCLLKLSFQIYREQKRRVALSIPCQVCCMRNKEKKRIAFYGYPQQYNNLGQYQQYGAADSQIISLKQDIINCTESILRGCQGSPIIMDGNIVGIITNSRRQCNQSQGVTVHQDMINNLKQWCAQLNGESFEINSSNLCYHLTERINKPKAIQSLLDYKKKVQGDFEQKELIEIFKYNRADCISKIPIPNKMINLISLDLNSNYSMEMDKLRQFNIDLLSQIRLPNLKKLNLQNNRIGDEGLRFLCRANYPSLRDVALDDNQITINGLKYIIYNSWDSEIIYQLYSVESNDNGYYLNVGKHIPTIKRIANEKSMAQIQKMILIDQQQSYAALNLLTLIPLQGESLQDIDNISKEIQASLLVESSKNPLSISSVLLQLKKCIGGSLKFNKKSDVKSKLSAKLIFSGLIGQRVSFTKKFQKLNNFHYSDFKNNHKKLKQFKDWYFELLEEQFVDTRDMSLDKVGQGCINATASDSRTSASTTNQEYFSGIPNQIRVFFERLVLTNEEFDARGDFQFPQIQRAENQQRGGFPYYQPVLGRRFGINVKCYGNDNKWLLMDGNKNEWAIAFHGVRNLNITNNSSAIKEMFDKRSKQDKIMLKKGPNQVHQNEKCMITGGKLGIGVYVTPYFLQALREYTNKNQDFLLVLQCRVEPESIRSSSLKPEFWVINKGEDIRPYGIILFTKKMLEQLKGKSHKTIYHNEQFTQESWKNKYKKMRENFKKK